MSKFCENCGAELKDTDKACPNCGAPVEEKQKRMLKLKILTQLQLTQLLQTQQQMK